MDELELFSLSPFNKSILMIQLFSAVCYLDQETEISAYYLLNSMKRKKWVIKIILLLSSSLELSNAYE